ncbi:MAG: OmpA family protein [Bacteroidales bacterium]|nr:OmpA family protein [Bacteroidales bacterium]
MTKKISGIIIICLIYTSAFSQNNQTIKGDLFYESYSYTECIEKFEGISDKSNELKRKLAESYFKTGNYVKSEEYYSQLANDDNKISDDIYNYAFVLSVNKKYSESEKWMVLFNKVNSSDKRGKEYIKNKGFYTKLLEDKNQFEIKNIDFNNEQEDFGTSYYKNKIVFASSRKQTQFVNRKWNWNKLPYLDLYIAETENGNLVKIKPFKKSINKKYHEGPASFSENGTFMVFTRNNYTGKSSDNVNKLQLYFSEFEKGEWKDPSPFLFNSKEFSTAHASLTPDGKTMYLASDMPGGFGGVDLYISKLNEDKIWTEPVNLGEKINTEGNEMFPFIHKNGYLFFASDGLPGLGGLDIFMTKVSENDFSTPLNPGIPINSSYDDFSFIIDKEMKTGYFSSSREEGKGNDDIYSFNMLKPFGVEIKGTTKDDKGNILAETNVILFDESGKIIGMQTTDENGNFSFTVETDKKYKLKGVKDKFSNGENIINTKGISGKVNASMILSGKTDFSVFISIMDKKTNEPIENVNVILLNKDTKLTDKFVTNKKGSFEKITKNKKINDKLKYKLILSKDGYMTKSVDYDITLKTEGKQELKMFIDKIEVGMDLNDIIEINPIYFDLNKYAIRSDAAIELDKIVKVMTENPNMIIELGSHTDSRGSDSYNLKLSDKRAKSSAKYIKERISNPNRIYGKGYGETKLKNRCKNGVKCSEKEHQENRRTEFKIIKQ